MLASTEALATPWTLYMARLALSLGIATLLLAAASARAERYIENNDRFPGWKGELPAEPGIRPNQTQAQSTPDTSIGFGELGQV